MRSASVLVVATLLGLTACSNAAPPEDESVPPVEAPTVEAPAVTPQATDGGLKSYGLVAPRRDSQTIYY